MKPFTQRTNLVALTAALVLNRSTAHGISVG